MWKRTTREVYWYALEVLPPAFQDGRGFLIGEPQDHATCTVTKTVMPRYDAYVHHKNRYYVSIRPLSVPEYKRDAAKLGGRRT